jgi:magnesium-transporting ATPase (P-type)
LAAAAAIFALVAIVSRGGPRGRAEIAAFVGTLAIVGTVAAVAYGYGWGTWVPAAAVAVGLIVVTNAAKLTVAVARIALPPIPAPGEKISHEELLDPVVDPQTLSDESSTWKAIIASVPESATRLTERSDLAKRLLIGFVAAGTVVLTAGSIAVVVRGHFLIHSMIVAALVTVICAFRSRLYAERWCAWWLLAASVAIPIGVMARFCLWYPKWAWAAVAVFVVVAIAALVIVGATEGIRRVSPVVRRVLEMLDGVAIAAVIPLLLWIAGGLALNVQRTARRQAPDRRLSAVETLGSGRVIRRDKTGTLTSHRMAVVQTGMAGGESDPADLLNPLLLRCAALRSNARLEPDPTRSSGEANPSWQAIGDPTETAMLLAADTVHRRWLVSRPAARAQ